jgi:hypothetical protein
MAAVPSVSEAARTRPIDSSIADHSLSGDEKALRNHTETFDRAETLEGDGHDTRSRAVPQGPGR